MTAEEFEQVKECARCAAVEQIHDFIIFIAVLWHFGFCPELVGTRLPVLSISLTLLTQMLRRFR